jgi:hypothetical protein
MADTFVDTPAEPATNRLQIVAAIILGVAATLTAFAAYKAGLTDGDALQGYTASTKTLSDANAFYAQGNQTSALDNQLFVQYVSAQHTGNADLAAYMKTLMREELVKAIDWWEATDAADTPFDDKPGNPYTIQDFDEAQSLETQAEKDFEDGKKADDQGDSYSLATVLFALALFFGGVATLLSRRIVTVALLLIAAVTVALGCIPLLTA